MIPERPTLLVAVAAGGGPDSVARAIAGHLADRHGIHARIVNLPDANGERALADFLTLPADGSTWLVAADSLVFAGRLLPRNSLAKELAAINGNSDNVFSVGDCVKVDSIMHAVWGGFTAVRTIAA